LLPHHWKALWKRIRKEIQDFLWDESRALLAALAFLVMLGGVLYLSGVFGRMAPYAYLAAARTQEILSGPGDPEVTYTKLLGMRPSWGSAYYQRGLLREKKKQWEEALSDFEMASTLSSFSGEAYVAHGRVSIAMGRTDQALWDFQTAIGKEPQNVDAYLERAKYYIQTKKFQDALVDYQKALELEPQSMDARIGVQEAKYGVDQSNLAHKMSGE
jgi:tetratricopeptide (TPR) repeat protein